MAPAGRLAVRPRHTRARTQREEEEKEEDKIVTHLTQWGCLSLFMVLASFILLFLFSGFRCQGRGPSMSSCAKREKAKESGSKQREERERESTEKEGEGEGGRLTCQLCR